MTIVLEVESWSDVRLLQLEAGRQRMHDECLVAYDECITFDTGIKPVDCINEYRLCIMQEWKYTWRSLCQNSMNEFKFYYQAC